MTPSNPSTTHIRSRSRSEKARNKSTTATSTNISSVSHLDLLARLRLLAGMFLHNVLSGNFVMAQVH